jgi:4-hydroxythreonine-4-phosphate dehydrogenase
MSIVGITMGCPAGIGPEIILRFFAGRNWPVHIRPVILGDIGILEKCAAALYLEADCKAWLPGTPIPDSGIPVLNLSSIDPAEHSWGQPSRHSGRAMAEYIQAAVRLIQSGDIDAMTTCPISKKSLQQAGYNYPGHTEMLVALTAAKRYTMMMAGETLKVTLATIHCPLSAVSPSLTISGIHDLIQITHHALQIDFGLASPRLAVAGLNPHSGEHGLFGSEEDEIIAPAIRHAAAAGIDVAGPFPPDTVFFKAASGEFDAVVCMYHDQGLIPFKLLHFKDGVNVPLGLPIVRTSVDHGTAYDIAGKGLADASSLSAAVSMAALISNNRQHYTH